MFKGKILPQGVKRFWQLPSVPGIVWLLFIPYVLTQVYCIHKLSLNNDEPLFASYGASILKLEADKDILYYESKLPITALNMIPRAVEQVFYPQLKKKWRESTIDIIRGRYITLLFSILLGLLIFTWSQQLYGKKTALYCFGMYLLCPNFLAHGIFVSTDIYACFFLTLSMYYLWRFLKTYKSKYFILMSVAVGLAQISKFSMLHLLIIIPLMILLNTVLTKKNSG